MSGVAVGGFGVTDNLDQALRQLRHICTGIDKTDVEDEDGWWETSVGAEFGAARLRDLERLVRHLFVEREDTDG